MDTPWHIEMLGWLRAVQRERVVARFRTHKTGALLAYLAYHIDRSHPREELIELFWPGRAPHLGRDSLSTALSSLRRQLEPPGVSAGAVIAADNATVRLNPLAVTTDVIAFEAGLRTAARAGHDTRQRQHLSGVLPLYRGVLLPGYPDSWILQERQRLAELFSHALAHLIARLEESGEWHAAIQWARRAVVADPLREEARRDLIRLLLNSGQPDVALCQYHEWERLLDEQLGATPAPELAALIVCPALGIHSTTARTGPQPLASLREAPPETTPHPAALVPPQPIRPTTGHLPLQLTRFFGREPEIERLCELLSPWRTADAAPAADAEPIRNPQPAIPHRLITLTGPGGSGKTRLALQAAHRLREYWADCIWFVSLVDLEATVPPDGREAPAPHRIVDRILDTLHLQRLPEVEPEELVTRFFSRQPCLLILDNVEHLVSTAAPLIQSWLERIASLTILATSRRSLNVAGEREIPVAPLPVPLPVDGQWLMADGPAKTARSDPSTIHHQLLTNASVQLLIDRAQAVRPDFQLTQGNAAAVAALCARLEGLPLALELAASRAAMLTPAQMLARLERPFDLLVSRKQTADARHHSLRAALDWSYQLLPPALQQFFARLSVFRGAWTLEAAETVCEEPEALHSLQVLRECSLVVAEENRDAMRYRLLETLREYGAEQLEPEERAALADRHAAYYMALAEEAEPGFHSAEWPEGLDRLAAEEDNLRAALAWSLGPSPADRQPPATGTGIQDPTRPPTLQHRTVGLRLAGALAHFWGFRNHEDEGRMWLEAALARCSDTGEPAARAKALYGAGLLAYLQGDSDAARSRLEASAAIFRDLGDSRGLAYSLQALGWRAFLQGEVETAHSLQSTSVALFRALPEPWGLVPSLNCLGRARLAMGDGVGARALIEESLAAARSSGDKLLIGWAIGNRGAMALTQGDLGAALSCFTEEVALSRELNHKRSIASALYNLASTLQAQGDHVAARSRFAECLAVRQELGDPRGLEEFLEHSTGVAGIISPSRLPAGNERNSHS